MRSIFSLSVLISSLSWVICTMLKVDIAMAAIDMPMAMNLLGLPGVEISILCGSALIMSRKSSSDPLMMARPMSVMDLVIDLKGSSCLSRS